jgi:2',3'-cyclic-nucleotide 2'-phosphodiesterase (5'-nucleotidase family)
LPGVDIIIGAHEHAKLEQAVQNGGALIVEAYQWGAYLGRLDVVVCEGQVVSHTYDLIPLTNDIPADPAIEARVAMLESELAQLYPDRFEVVGTAAVDISDAKIRFQESPLGNLVCDIVRQSAGADMAVVPSLTMLNALFKGTLVVQDIFDALPYPNQIVRLSMTGEQLQRVLDLGASSGGTGNFVQVSGVRFCIAGGSAVDVMIDGAPLDRQKRYVVASTDYHVRRAIDYRPLFAVAQDTADIGVTVKEALMAYIRANSPIEACTDGRITVKEDARAALVPQVTVQSKQQLHVSETVR